MKAGAVILLKSTAPMLLFSSEPLAASHYAKNKTQIPRWHCHEWISFMFFFTFYLLDLMLPPHAGQPSIPWKYSEISYLCSWFMLLSPSIWNSPFSHLCQWISQPSFTVQINYQLPMSVPQFLQMELIIPLQEKKIIHLYYQKSSVQEISCVYVYFIASDKV